MKRWMSARLMVALFLSAIMLFTALVRRDASAQQSRPQADQQDNFTGKTSSLDAGGMIAGRRR